MRLFPLSDALDDLTALIVDDGEVVEKGGVLPHILLAGVIVGHAPPFMMFE